MGTDETKEISPVDSLTALKNSRRFPEDLPFIQDEKSWQNLMETRSVVANSEVVKQNLPVYYPGSGRDITRALGFTDATNFVFVDYSYAKNGVAQISCMPDYAITSLGGKIVSDKTEGILGEEGRRIVEFEWNGKIRTIVLYSEDITKFRPPEISRGTSMTLLIGVGGEPDSPTDTSKFQKDILESVAPGGFICMVPPSPVNNEELKFTKILSPELDVEGRPCGYPLYQKIL